jgi:hypothetical protein
MRADMFKVIVERPRWDRAWSDSPRLKRSDDYKTIGLKRHAAVAGQGGKGFNENLAPLIRLLRCRRGRRWDDVFSEICAQLDTGSMVKMHVRMHLEDFVMTDLSRGRYGEWMRQGRVVTLDYLRWRRHFFVDPDDGVLKDIAVLRRRLEAVR